VVTATCASDQSCCGVLHRLQLAQQCSADCGAAHYSNPTDWIQTPRLQFLLLPPSSIERPGVIVGAGSTQLDRAPRRVLTVSWLSMITPRSRALSTTGTLAANTGMSRMSTCTSCWLKPSHMTCVCPYYSVTHRSRSTSSTMYCVIYKLNVSTRTLRPTTIAKIRLRTDCWNAFLLQSFKYGSESSRERKFFGHSWDK